MSESIVFRPVGDRLDDRVLLDIEPHVARLSSMAGTRNDWQDDIDEATVQIRGRRCQ